MDRPWWESPVCWLCDYGLFVVTFSLILILGMYRFLYTAILVGPLMMPTPTATQVIAMRTNTPFPTELSSTPTVTMTSTPAPEKPEYILVFLPVNWKSSQSAFERSAQDQADTFISESGVEKYFDVKVVILENGVETISLGSDTLVLDVLEFALQQQPGDRYIGLTDGDLSLEGKNDVVGWTSGGFAMVAEYQEEYVVAHELGHTFGLCDEYSYTDWSRQDKEYVGGCPNPYPENCPREESNVPICRGDPASDGSNSIMGPAGVPGEYSFNDASYKQLQNFFKNTSNGDTP